MAQTLVSLYVHIVFSTKNRADLIAPEIENELFAHIGGVLRKRETVLVAGNGTANHVHLLISMSKKFALSDLVREIKKASSLWIKQKGAEFENFHWQDGFGAFSVGQTQIEDVKKYIVRQKEKHKAQNFEDEIVDFTANIRCRLMRTICGTDLGNMRNLCD